MLKQKTTRESSIFSAIKQIETVIIHYNEKLDGAFVKQLEEYIVRVAKKIKKVDLKNPNENGNVHVYIYPSIKLFNEIFGAAIEKRYYNRHRTMEDLYIVRDDNGNIHMASPRGKSTEKTDMLTKILVVKILGEYMDEKEKTKLNMVTREAFKEKVREEQKKKEEKEKEKEQEEEEEKEEEEQEEVEEEEIEDEEMGEMTDTQEKIEEIIEEKELPVWIIIGWQGYIKGKLKKDSDIEKFSKYVNRRGYVKGTKVEKTVDEEFAIGQVNYIIDTYGFNIYRKIIEAPEEIYKIMHTTKFKFDREVKAYIYSKYVLGEMKLEMDEKTNKGEIEDITILEITSSNSCNIIEGNELNEKIKQ